MLKLCEHGMRFVVDIKHYVMISLTMYKWNGSTNESIFPKILSIALSIFNYLDYIRHKPHMYGLKK